MGNSECAYLNYILVNRNSHEAIRVSYPVHNISPYREEYEKLLLSHRCVHKFYSDEIPELDSEFFIPVKGFEYRYLISNLGRVKSMSVTKKYGYREILLTPQLSKENGYYYFGFRSADGEFKRRTIHRMVLISFSGDDLPENYEKLDCMHLDHVRDNPKLTNLRWGTRQENEQDKIKANRRNQAFGTRISRSKLTDENVVEIKVLLKNGLPTTKISEMFNVSNQCISDIKLGETWKHVN